MHLSEWSRLQKSLVNMNDQHNDTDFEEPSHYSEVFLHHLCKPRNVGIIDNPDGFGEARSKKALCGDIVRMMFSVKANPPIPDSPENRLLRARSAHIISIKFKVYGCAVVIASASMISELALGRTIDELNQITVETVSHSLEGIPPKKYACVQTAIDALQSAVLNYLSKHQ